jgi:hypothetical protein
MNASSYTYVRLTTTSGDVWVASSQFPVKVGDRLSAVLETPMQNFHSPSLNRDFSVIYFTSRVAPEGQSLPPAGGASMAMPQGDPAQSAQGAVTPPPMAVGHGSAPPQANAGPVTPVAPPAGGVSVEHVWTNRASLSGQAVTVRGKVVKVNNGILDRNWVHVQDGSGNAKDGTNDLTITTSAVVKVGDVVTFSGKVGVNRDFGAGYAYKVMLEGAGTK